MDSEEDLSKKYTTLIVYRTRQGCDIVRAKDVIQIEKLQEMAGIKGQDI